MQIRRAEASDTGALVELSLLAWEPVFDSFRQILGPAIYALTYPDWRTQQRATVEQVCAADSGMTIWVAAVGGDVAGFIAYSLKSEEQTGVVELLAVHPAHQRRGIGTALNLHALQQMKDAGIRLVDLHTGGDPGHAPARRAYEKAGYTALPLVHYYKAL